MLIISYFCDFPLCLCFILSDFFTVSFLPQQFRFFLNIFVSSSTVSFRLQRFRFFLNSFVSSSTVSFLLQQFRFVFNSFVSSSTVSFLLLQFRFFFNSLSFAILSYPQTNFQYCPELSSFYHDLILFSSHSFQPFLNDTAEQQRD